jgi:hypothetical protein
MPASRALELIREAAAAGRVLYPCLDGQGAWYSLATRRQVMKCLLEGELVDGPRINEHGDIECSMSVFCAGIDVKIDVVVKEMAGWTAIIIRVGNRK